MVGERAGDDPAQQPLDRSSELPRPGRRVPRLSCRVMDAQAIKNLGGALQIVGVVIVVWDLLNIHEYLGDLGRLTVRMRTWRVRLEAALRRPGRPTVVHARTAASAVGIADSVTARVTPGSFVPDPGQSLAEQLAAQAAYLNRLRDWIMREVDQRDRAVEEARAQVRSELQAARAGAAVDPIRAAAAGRSWARSPLRAAYEDKRPAVGSVTGPTAGGIRAGI
jgi:hypothetical protein